MEYCNGSVVDFSEFNSEYLFFLCKEKDSYQLYYENSTENKNLLNFTLKDHSNVSFKVFLEIITLGIYAKALSEINDNYMATNFTSNILSQLNYDNEKPLDKFFNKSISCNLSKKLFSEKYVLISDGLDCNITNYCFNEAFKDTTEKSYLEIIGDLVLLSLISFFASIFVLYKCFKKPAENDYQELNS